MQMQTFTNGLLISLHLTRQMAKETVILVTGCSSGIGLKTAVKLAKDGDKRFKVYATLCLIQLNHVSDKLSLNLDLWLLLLEKAQVWEVRYQKA